MKTAPDPKDIQEFLFKQSSISQILDAYTAVPNACSLLAADKKRGLVYVSQNNKLVVLKPGEDSDPEWKIEFNLSITVSKLTLNCDCSYLAVAPHGPTVLIYDVYELVRNNLQLLYEIRISSSSGDVFVRDLKWNPTMPGILCTVASDYTIGSFNVKDKKEKTVELKALERFNDIDAICAAWSPKGKQIVVGCKNGNIVQFTAVLKVAKAISGPNPYIGEVVSILWISSYQFCAAYLDSEQHINVLIVDAPKEEKIASFTCYEDITYGMIDTEGQGMFPCYYFNHVPEWGLIIAASSNSSEIAVLGSTDAGATWSQWQLVDSGRAEIPLICTMESYPVGLAIDRTPARKLPWGADSTLPNPVPILHILSTSGQLCSFHMINLTPNCPVITSPPTEIVPTPPQAQPAAVSEASLILNGAITSTPRPKQVEHMPERTKLIPNGNIFDKLSNETTFLTQTPPEEQKQQEHIAEGTNSTMKVETPKEVKPPQTALDTPIIIKRQRIDEQKPSLDDNATAIRAYIEEHNLFEKELRSRLEPQVLKCGTEEDHQKFEEAYNVIDQFLRDLRETTSSLSSDIAYLKALLLQSFAWVEEAKSKNAATNELSSRSCGELNKIAEVQKLYYCRQAQLEQACKILDMKWSDHMSEERVRMKIPNVEFIYQNLMLHSKIIQEVKSKVEHLQKRWKMITRSNNIFGLNHSMSNLSIASTKSSTTPPRDARIIEARCKAIASKTFSFTEEKQRKLREHLSSSSIRVIKPANPSPIQHRLESTLSSLASRNDTSVEVKPQPEQTVLKQPPVSNQQITAKVEPQNPLAFLDSIVAGIGTSETNTIPVQTKLPEKQTGFNVFSSCTVTTKPVLTENKTSTSAMPSIVQNVPASTTQSVLAQSMKPKQDSNVFNATSHAAPSLLKSFPNVSSITFGSSSQEPDQSITQKSVPKETPVKTGKETSTDTLKLKNNLFGTNSLKETLTLETPSEKVQTITSNAGLKFGLPVSTSVTPTTTKSIAMSTLNFGNPVITTASVNSFSQSILNIPRSSAAQAFSFASDPSSVKPFFNVNVTPSTTAKTMASEAQEPLTSSNGEYNKSTFGMSNFQTLLEQPVTTTTVTPSVTIQKVLFTQTTASQPIPTTPSSIVTSPFSSQPITPNISVFVTNATVAGTKTTPAIAPPLFSGAAISVTPSTTTTGTTATTPNPTSSLESSSANAISTTLNFGTVATMSTASTFPNASSTQTTYSQSWSPISSTEFQKPIVSSPVSPPNSSCEILWPQQQAKYSDMPFTFGGNTTQSNSIFGGNTPTTSSTSMFGGNATTSNTFASLLEFAFDNNGQKSFFGDSGNATSPVLPSTETTRSVFGSGAVGNTSPMGIQQSPLGAQPAFGQIPVFTSKPVFGSAFGEQPTIGENFSAMDNTPKVFGDVTGSSTFESLASQSGGLSFSSLAQNNTNTPEAPAFTSGSSFTAWR